MAKFSQSAYDAFDKKAKYKLIEIMAANPKFQNCTLREPVDQYTADFEFYLFDRHIGNIEVEVKSSWVGEKFPFADIQLLPRKKKFWFDKQWKGKPTAFVMFNHDLSHHLVLTNSRMRSIYEGNDRRQYQNLMTRATEDNFYVCPTIYAKMDYFYQTEPPIDVNRRYYQ